MASPNKVLKCAIRFWWVKVQIGVVISRERFYYWLLLEETRSYAKYEAWVDTGAACLPLWERRSVSYQRLK